MMLTMSVDNNNLATTHTLPSNIHSIEVTSALTAFTDTFFGNQWMKNDFFITTLSDPLEDLDIESIESLSRKDVPKPNITHMRTANMERIVLPVLPIDIDEDFFLDEEDI
jgi:hypothetical protein